MVHFRRASGLTSREVGSEVLVLGAADQQVIALDGDLAAVWRASVEADSIPALSGATGLEETRVEAALHALVEKNMMQTAGMDRRVFLRRSALVGAGVAGSMALMELPAAASTISSGQGMATYDLGTVLGLYTAANKSSTTDTTTGDDFSFYASTAFTPVAKSSSYTVSTPSGTSGPLPSTKTMAGFYTTGTNNKPRFLDADLAKGNADNDAIGYVDGNAATSSYNGFSATTEAMVAVNKQASAVTSTYYALVVAFSIPSGYTSASFAVSADGGTSANMNTTGSTVAQFVSSTGVVLNSVTVPTAGAATPTVTVYSGSQTATAGSTYYAVVYDTKSSPAKYPIIGLTYTISLS